LKRGKSVFARGHVVQGTGKKLVALLRPPEFIGKYARLLRRRKTRFRIDSDIPDLVAEVTVDPFPLYPIGSGWIGVIGLVDCSQRNVTGGAIAGMIRIVESQSGAVIRFLWIRRQRDKSAAARALIARERAAAS